MSFSDLLRHLSQDTGNNGRIEDMIKQMCNSDRSSDEWLSLLSHQFSEELQTGHRAGAGYDESSSLDSLSSKKYQATVEDGTDSEDGRGRVGSRRRHSGRRSTSSVLWSLDSDSDDAGDFGSDSDSLHSHLHHHHRYNNNNDRYPFSSSSPAASTIPTSPGSTVTGPKSVRFSDRGPPMVHQTSCSVDGARESRRYSYTAPQREYFVRDEKNESTRHGLRKLRVDVKWGKLFDEQGRPTDRLKQVIFAVAHHLVTKYPPADSLVISPIKLKTFYTKYAVDSETLPSQMMFTEDAPRSMSSLQSLYERLQCEFLLIPPHPGSTTPSIPALTPRGFKRWFTLFVESYPQKEALRLSKLVADVPLTTRPLSSSSSPASPVEKLPSNMSPSIFPSHGIDETRLLVEGALKKWENDMGLRASFSYDRSSGSFSLRGSVPRMTTSCLSDLRTYSELQRGLDGSRASSSRRHSTAYDDSNSSQWNSPKRGSAADSRESTRHKDGSYKAHAPGRRFSTSSAHTEEAADQDRRYRRGRRDSSESDRHSDKYRGRGSDRSPDVASSRHTSRHTSKRRHSPFSHTYTNHRSGNVTSSSRSSSFSPSSSRSESPYRRSKTSSRHRSSDKSHRDSGRRDREHHHRHHHREEEVKERRRRVKDDHCHKLSKRKEEVRDCERERETVQSNSGRRRVR